MAFNKNIDDFIKERKARDAELISTQSTAEPIWRDVRSYLHPRSARFRGEQVNDGTRQDGAIINTSPRYAVRTLPSGMQSGITSPMRPWFKLGLPDRDMEDHQEYRIWLDLVAQRMRQTLQRSNIYDRLKSNYGILGSYGTSCLWVDEDVEDVVRGYDILMGSFRLYTDDTGRVVGLHRDVKMTTLHIIKKFKAGGKVPVRVQEAFDRGDYNQYFHVLHIVEPNPDYNPNSFLPHKKKYMSIWMDMERAGEESILKLSGYTDIPFFAPRWDVEGENVYGTGCGELAIGDAKQLQLLEKRKLQGVDKNVRPPMLADASLRNHRTSTLPGDTTYVNNLINGNPGYRPAYQINPNLNELRVEIEAVENRIDEAYYKNLFLIITDMADQPNITATQINAMREEKLLMLGPVLERLNDELLDPLIDRVFSVMFKRGLIPPPPQELEGVPLRVEYVSVLAQAQKAMGLGNIERFIGFTGQTAQLQGATGEYPEVLDKVNFDEVLEAYADNTAVPPQFMFDQATTQLKREGRAQAAQQQNAVQQAATAASVAKDLAGTPMGDSNALQQTLEATGAA